MAKAQNLGVATIGSATEGINAVKKQIAELKRVQEAVYKTPGKISMGGGSSVDIKEVKEEKELVKAFSVVLSKINAFDAAYAALGITSYPVVKVDGGSLDEWSEDIKLRRDVIKYQGRLDKLNNVKKRYEDLMDKQDKMNLLNKEMEDLLQED